MFEAALIENGCTDLANYFFKLFVSTGTMSQDIGQEILRKPPKKSENWKYRIFLLATIFVANINQFGIECFDYQI